MDRVPEYLPAILGALVSILSILKSVGLFEMKNRRIDRIEKLNSIYTQLDDNSQTKKDIEGILSRETKKLKESVNKTLDFGGLFAMIFISIIMGFLTYYVAIVDTAIIVTGQATIFKGEKQKEKKR